MTEKRPCYILMGPQNPTHIREADGGQAPRVDTQLLARRMGAVIMAGADPPSRMPGHRLINIGRSLLANGRLILRLVRSIPLQGTVYSTGETWGLPCAVALGLLRKKKVCHIMYVHRVFSPNWRRLLRLLRILLKVDVWICVTAAQRDILTATLGPAARIMVVSQGVDTKFYAPRPGGNITEGASYLLAVGVEMRDYGLLFDAVRLLKTRLVVKSTSTWMALAREHIVDVPPNVTIINEWLGYEALRDLYAGALAVVVPLKDTPQAAGITAIQEAMAMGKCVITTRSAGLPDCLINGETGLVVSSNVTELTKAIKSTLVDGNCQEMAERARQHIQETASLEVYLQALVNIWQECCLDERPSNPI